MSDSPEDPTQATAQPAEPESPPAPADPWRVPLHCFHCGGSWDVPRRAFRTGGVLHCAHCRASFVVQTLMFRALVDKIEALEARGLGADDETAKREIEALSREFRPPGTPRKPAGIFG